MTNDEVFIDYLMGKRVRRRIKNPDELHQIYSKKYAKWIMPFLRKHNVPEAPPLVFCNTLYRFPDYFGYEDRFFFLFDYYLYDYIYDMNFALDEPENNEFLYNLWIKVYIENLFLRGDIDTCYKFCITSLALEDYKTEEKYRNVELMYKIVDLSDIQEAVILLHEATHFLYEKFASEIKNSQTYMEISQVLHNYLEKNKYSIPVLKMTGDPTFDRGSLLEECYCDTESVHFVMDKLFDNGEIGKEDLFIQIFRTILSMYFLHFIMTAHVKDVQLYTDCRMHQLTYRLGNIYATVISYLIKNDKAEYRGILDKVYVQQLQEFVLWSGKIRKFMDFMRCELDDFSIEQDFDMEYETIREFLCLL